MPSEIKEKIQRKISKYTEDLNTLRGNKTSLEEQLRNIRSQLKNTENQLRVFIGAIESLKELMKELEPSQVIEMPKKIESPAPGKIDETILEDLKSEAKS